MATDLAEFVGAAIALNLLFGVPLFVAGLITAVVAFAILGLQTRGYRRFETTIAGLLGVILLGFLYDIAPRRRRRRAASPAGFVPGFAGTESILLATGILGATVMPHVIYLHSALTQGRIQPRDDAERRELLRFERLDVGLAMGIAGLVNISMLVVAAALFHGVIDIDSIEGAYARLRRPARRRRGARLRARAAGLGPVELERRHLRRPGRHAGLHPPLGPAAAAAAGHDAARAGRAGDRASTPTTPLVISQVVLSFGIPFALVPLVLLTRRARRDGRLRNARGDDARRRAWWPLLIIALNLFLLVKTFAG